MFVAAEAVHREGDVHFCVCSTFRCDDKAKFPAGLDNPLADLSVTGQVGLDQVGTVFLLVAFEYSINLLIRLEVVKKEDASPGGKNPGPDHLAGSHSIAVDKNIVGR